MTALKNNAYQKLALDYDFLTGEGVVESYKNIIGKREGEDILDLGCGTGTLLKEYSLKNSTYGVDISAQMIKVARKKDRKSKYLVGDITKIKLDKKFDVVVCAFDTINHLSSLDEWEDLFEKAFLHLKKDGVFVCDFNTPECLEMAARHRVVKRSSGVFLTMQPKIENDICFWEIDRFKKIAFSYWRHEKIVIKQTFYPIEHVLERLGKYFKRKELAMSEQKRAYVKAYN